MYIAVLVATDKFSMNKILMMFIVVLSSALQVKPTQDSTDDVRLVGGSSHCTGSLEIKHQGEWKPGYDEYWNLKSSAVVCRQLACGSAVSTERSSGSQNHVWTITSSCVGSESSLRECGTKKYDISSVILKVICSESVRLVNGTSVCSGRVEVKSNQSWGPVCEGDFDQHDAGVVCRELGCGAPSVLQGALYGEVKAPMWTKEFQCEGSESVLLDCGTSGSTRNTCSSDHAVGLICSEPDDVRLVGGTSNCNGRLEMKYQGEWRPVDGYIGWNLTSSAVVCRQLFCGPAISTERRSGTTDETVWWITSPCVGSESSLRECVTKQSFTSSDRLEVICSDLLFKPNITIFPPMNGVSEGQQQGLQVFEGSKFTITCSIHPQYPGGSFHLTFTGSNTIHNQTQPAVNHSTNFLFPAADHTHQGNYICVYRVNVFERNLSSASKLLSLTVTVSNLTAEIIRCTLISLVLLILLISIITVHCLWKATTRGQRARVENIEMTYYNLPVRKPGRAKTQNRISNELISH